jgi:DNA-directed RNA polymerase subunit RPC12/RpoP
MSGMWSKCKTCGKEFITASQTVVNCEQCRKKAKAKRYGGDIPAASRKRSKK